MCICVVLIVQEDGMRCGYELSSFPKQSFVTFHYVNLYIVFVLFSLNLTLCTLRRISIGGTAHVNIRHYEMHKRNLLSFSIFTLAWYSHILIVTTVW